MARTGLRNKRTGAKGKLAVLLLSACLLAGSFGTTAKAKEAVPPVGVADEETDIEVLGGPEEAVAAVSSAGDLSGTDAANADAGEELNRVVLQAEGEIPTAYGAARGFYYETGNEYVLEYDSKEEAEYAREKLSEVYGEDRVFADRRVHLTDADENSGMTGAGLSASGEDTSVSGENAPVPKEGESVSESDAFDGISVMGMDTLKEKSSEWAGEVTVAVVDSGIYAAHPAFSDRLDLENSTNLLGGELKDYHGHGTHVAGIIADATPAQVKIMAVQVFDESDDATLFTVQCAVDYAVEKGADVINLSLGGNQVPQSDKDLLDTALAGAVKNGAVVCAAAGQEFTDVENCYPASSRWTVAVTAFGKGSGGAGEAFERYRAANTGSLLDFAAPGVKIESAWNDGKTYVESGTSMACPHLCAAAAMVRLRHPDYNQWDVYAAFLDNTVDLGAPGKDELYGCGYVDLAEYADRESNRTDGKRYQAIQADAMIAKQENDEPFSLAVELSRGDGALTVVSSDPETASVDGNRVTIHKAGTCELIVTAGETESFLKTERRLQLVVHGTSRPVLPEEPDPAEKGDADSGGSAGKEPDTGEKNPDAGEDEPAAGEKKPSSKEDAPAGEKTPESGRGTDGKTAEASAGQEQNTGSVKIKSRAADTGDPRPGGWRLLCAGACCVLLLFFKNTSCHAEDDML